MASLQIRDGPPEVLDALKLRARRANRSLAQQALVELRKLPELESRERRLEIVQRIREEPAVRRLSISPEEILRQDRDR
jgi:plasmid stability protein